MRPILVCAGTLLALPLISSAQFGIGVSPAELVFESGEFPVSSTLFVKNSSDTPQVFEVLSAGPAAGSITLTPSKFALLPGETKRVLVEADGPLESKLAVVSVRQTPEGLNTGAGIEIPLKVFQTRSLTSFLAASLSDLPLPPLSGVVAALALFVLLRMLVFLVKEGRRGVVRGQLHSGESVSFE